MSIVGRESGPLKHQYIAFVFTLLGFPLYSNINPDGHCPYVRTDNERPHEQGFRENGQDGQGGLVRRRAAVV